MNTSDILYLAEQKLTPEGAWIQHGFAAKVWYEGTEYFTQDVQPWSPNANCFCSIGALSSVIKPANYDKGVCVDYADIVAVQLLLQAIALRPQYPAESESYIERWNDNEAREQEEVIAAFQRARVLALNVESNNLCPEESN